MTSWGGGGPHRGGLACAGGRLLAPLCALVMAMACAPASVPDPPLPPTTAPSTSVPTDARILARAAVVTAADLGSGWTAELTDDRDAGNPGGRCLLDQPENLALDPEQVLAGETSPVYRLPAASNVALTAPPPTGPPASRGPAPAPGGPPTTAGGPLAFGPLPVGLQRVTSFAVVATTANLARRAEGDVTSQRVVDCIIGVSTRRLSPDLATDARLAGSSGAQLKLPALAPLSPDAASVRVTLQVTTGGNRVPVYLDIAGVRRGRVVAVVVLLATAVPWSPDTEGRLVTTVAARLGSGGADPVPGDARP